MRQVPMLSDNPYYSLNNDIKFVTPTKKVKWFARYHVWGPQMGNVTTAIFNSIKLSEIFSLWLLIILSTGGLSPLATAFCWIIAIILAIKCFMNDVLLFIPPEEAMKIETTIMGNRDLAHSVEEYQQNSRWPIMNTCLRFTGYSILYSAYGILSANAAVGALAVMPNHIIAKIFGVIIALLGTELGIFYYHLIFYPRIQQFLDFLKNPPKKISPILIAQLIKNFSMILIYYSSNGIFYLDSLVEQLEQSFPFAIHQNALNIAMITSGGLVLINTVVTRLPATLRKQIEKQADGISQQEKIVEYLMELIINASAFTMSIRRFQKSPIISGAGAVASIVSLLIGLYCTYSYPTKVQAQSSENEISFLASWLNGFSRFTRTLLTYAAIERIDQLLYRRNQIETGLDILDKLNLTAIIGIYIGLNGSALYKKIIDTHVKYIQKKWEMASEKKSGFISSLFKAAEEHENPKDKFALLKILNPETMPMVFV